MSLGLRLKDRLDGHSNYSTWRERIQSIFEEAEVWGIMVHTAQRLVTVPANSVQLADFNKKNAKRKILILDGVKGHVLPHVIRNTYAHEMWIALTNIYQSTIENKKNGPKGEVEGH